MQMCVQTKLNWPLLMSCRVFLRCRYGGESSNAYWDKIDADTKSHKALTERRSAWDGTCSVHGIPRRNSRNLKG